MTRLLIAAALGVVAVVVALVLQRRKRRETVAGDLDEPPAGHWSVPERLDRADFARPEAPWLVAVFSSASCSTCASVVAKAHVLAGPHVAVEELEVGARREVHRRYGVEAVPLTVVADAGGVVQASFLGPVTATDLWAAVAELRDPGSSPEPGLGHRDA